MVENPILRDKISYSFEPSGNDKVTSLSKEHDAELYLNKVSQSVVRWVGGVKCNWWAESIKNSCIFRKQGSVRSI